MLKVTHSALDRPCPDGRLRTRVHHGSTSSHHDSCAGGLDVVMVQDKGATIL